MHRRNRRRQHQTIVIRVRHDQPTYQASRYSPGGCPDKLLALRTSKLYLVCAREILPKEMRCSCLKRLSVLHHSFNRPSIDGTGKALAGRLFAYDDRNAKGICHKVLVHLQNEPSFLDGLFTRSMSGMPFLPKELRRSQEQARSHFPTHDVAPLVDEQRQVFGRLNPARERVADNCLACRANDQRLLKFRIWIGNQRTFVQREAMMGNDSTLLRKALHVLSLLLEKSQWYQEREIGVAVSGSLQQLVEPLLNIFPDGVSPRLDVHASAYFGVLRKVSSLDHLLVPLCEILLPRNFEGRLHALGRFDVVLPGIV